jgi:hypothetical protein
MNPQTNTNSIESRDHANHQKAAVQIWCALDRPFDRPSEGEEPPPRKPGWLAASSSPARASRNDLLPPLDLAYIPLEDLRIPAREIRKLDPAHVREVANSISMLAVALKFANASPRASRPLSSTIQSRQTALVSCFEEIAVSSTTCRD